MESRERQISKIDDEKIEGKELNRWEATEKKKGNMKKIWDKENNLTILDW